MQPSAEGSQLCGHHLDRLRVLAMASVVRLNGGPIDRILEGLWCVGALVETRKGIGCAHS